MKDDIIFQLDVFKGAMHEPETVASFYRIFFAMHRFHESLLNDEISHDDYFKRITLYTDEAIELFKSKFNAGIITPSMIEDYG